MRCKRTRDALAITHTLCFASNEDSTSIPDNYYQTLPLVLGGSLPNIRSLTFRNCLSPPYHSSFITFVTRFSGLAYLGLYMFKVSSSTDLLRMILSLPKLRELRLVQGRVASEIHPPFGPLPILASGRSTPRLDRLHLSALHPALLIPLTDWLVSFGACKDLSLLCLGQLEDIESKMPAKAIVQALSPSLTALCYASPPIQNTKVSTTPGMRGIAHRQ